MFSEKLNFLMNITDTLNSNLAFAVSVDASHISRLRHGSRKLPKNQSFVKPMARYFARHINDAFQKKIIADVLHISGEFPKNEEAVAEIICKWLLDNDTEKNIGVSAFLRGISGSGKTFQKPEVNENDEISYNEGHDSFYYGNEGKRDAVVRFLSEITKENTPQTLLLFSDEDMSWLNEDIRFTKKWALLLLKVIQNGNKIKIIHTISRSSDEMMEALTKWMPIYMTGAVESYYYPKLRDGLFKRTMFIAPKTGAVISNSVRSDTSEMLNIYVDNPLAVAAIEAEFSRYMAMCRPLMSIMNAVSKDRFWTEFADFHSIDAPTIMLTPIPSLMTMPEDTAKTVACQCPGIYKLWQDSLNSFNMVTSENKFIEILTPACAEGEKIPLPMADMHAVNELFYTKADYAKHLKNTLKTSANNPNYSVFYTDAALQDITIYVKEDVGVLIAKSSAPTTVFAFNEPNMVAAVWSYLLDIAENLEKRQKNNDAIKKLIASLK